MCKKIAFMAVIMGLGLLCYILLGFRWGLGAIYPYIESPYIPIYPPITLNPNPFKGTLLVVWSASWDLMRSRVISCGLVPANFQSGLVRLH